MQTEHTASSHSFFSITFGQLFPNTLPLATRFEDVNLYGFALMRRAEILRLALLALAIFLNYNTWINKYPQA